MVLLGYQARYWVRKVLTQPELAAESWVVLVVSSLLQTCIHSRLRVARLGSDAWLSLPVLARYPGNTRHPRYSTTAEPGAYHMDGRSSVDLHLAHRNDTT